MQSLPSRRESCRSPLELMSSRRSKRASLKWEEASGSCPGRSWSLYSVKILVPPSSQQSTKLCVGKCPRNRASFPLPRSLCLLQACSSNICRGREDVFLFQINFGRQPKANDDGPYGAATGQPLYNSSMDWLDFLYAGTHGWDPYATVWMDLKGMNKPLKCVKLSFTKH